MTRVFTPDRVATPGPQGFLHSTCDPTCADTAVERASSAATVASSALPRKCALLLSGESRRFGRAAGPSSAQGSATAGSPEPMAIDARIHRSTSRRSGGFSTLTVRPFIACKVAPQVRVRVVVFVVASSGPSAPAVHGPWYRRPHPRAHPRAGPSTPPSRADRHQPRAATVPPSSEGAPRWQQAGGRCGCRTAHRLQRYHQLAGSAEPCTSQLPAGSRRGQP